MLTPAIFTAEHRKVAGAAATASKFYSVKTGSCFVNARRSGLKQTHGRENTTSATQREEKWQRSRDCTAKAWQCEWLEWLCVKQRKPPELKQLVDRSKILSKVS